MDDRKLRSVSTIVLGSLAGLFLAGTASLAAAQVPVSPASPLEAPPLVQAVANAAVYLLGGAVLVYGAPATTGSVVERVRDDPLVTGLVGFGSALALLATILALVLTVIGILVAIPLAIAYTVLVVAGSIVGAIVAGSLVLNVTDVQGHGPALLVGTAIAAGLNLVPILGPIGLFVLNTVGVGGVVMHLKETHYDDRGDGRVASANALDRPDETDRDVATR